VEDPLAFDLGSLVSNSDLDFISAITQDEDDLLDTSDTPYSQSTFSTVYTDPLSYTTLNFPNSNLSIFSLNIQSLPSKFNEFCDLINLLLKNDCCPEIICLQEIWQITDPTPFHLPGFQPIIYRCRTTSSGGGVAIYIKNGLPFKLLPNLSIFIDKLFESLFLEITLLNGKKFTIASIYRPNSKYSNLSLHDQFTQFNDILLNTLASIDPSHSTFLMGDLNLDALKYGSNQQVTSYIDSLFTSGFIQTITKPTRCTNHSATLIDHAITNITQTTYTSHILTSKISDHFPFITFTEITSPRLKKKTHTFRNFSTDNINSFNQALLNMSWQNVTSSPCSDTAFNAFDETFTHLHDLHFSPKTVKFNINFHKLEPWMSKGLLISRKTKLKLASTLSKSPSHSNQSTYKNYRNIYNSLIRLAKKNHFSKALNANTRNLKKTWSIIKFALNVPKASSTINSLFHNNTLITDPLTIASTFNTYFTNVANEIASQIHPTNSSFSPTNRNDDIPNFCFSDQPITTDEIISGIDSLEDKRTPDMSGISTSIIKKIKHSITTPLLHIFSLSLSTGKVPCKLKTAKIVPIFKSGNCLDIANYRPISLLSSFSKILEKLVHKRLYSYLDTNNLITSQQFGFRPNHSTSHPMTLLLNKLTSALNNKKHSIVIFCDLKKAFDTCNHSLLLKKLHSLGVRGVELGWFEDYLTNRKQFVSINDFNSTLQTILTGVPQGSILGPLLFLIYINDLPNCSLLYSLLFADDTALTASADSYQELFDFVNTELHKLCTYFRLNKLSLHPDKTKYLLISHNNSKPPEHLHLYLNNNNNNSTDPLLISTLSCVKSTDKIPAIKYLGVYFDPQLNFKYHVSQISKKLSSALFTLRRIKKLLPPTTLKTLYYTLFHCHLTYGIETWSCTSESTLKPLITKQKAAIRIISNSKYNAHTEPLFKKLAILPINSLITCTNLKFVHSCIFNHSPTALRNTWITAIEQRHITGRLDIVYNLRNNDDLYIPPSRLVSLQKFPLYNFPKIWNELQPDLRDIPSRISFKILLKKNLLAGLSDKPNCSRLFCPTCSLQPPPTNQSNSDTE